MSLAVARRPEQPRRAARTNPEGWSIQNGRGPTRCGQGPSRNRHLSASRHNSRRRRPDRRPVAVPGQNAETPGANPGGLRHTQRSGRRDDYFSSMLAPAASRASLGPVGILLGGALKHRLRGTVNQVLGILQAEVGERTHLLDDLDLLVAGARSGLRRRRSALLLPRHWHHRRERRLRRPPGPLR